MRWQALAMLLVLACVLVVVSTVLLVSVVCRRRTACHCGGRLARVVQNGAPSVAFSRSIVGGGARPTIEH